MTAIAQDDHLTTEAWAACASTHSESIKVHVSMVKEKRNGLTFTERSVKICRFRILPLSPPYLNNATKLQRNRSAHTAWVRSKRSIY